MFSLLFGGAYLGGALLTPATSAELVITGTGSSRELRLVDFASGITSRFSIAAGSIGGFLGQTSQATARTGIVSSDFHGSVETDALTAALQPTAASSVTGYLRSGAEFDDRVALLGAGSGGVNYLVAARSAASGFSVFNLAGATPAEVAHVTDTPAAYAAGIAAIATLTLAGRTFILTGSATESGVSSYELLGGGQVVHRDSLGVTELVPLQGLTALRTVSVAGQDFVVGGSATNSGLTVLAVAPDGMLAATDHIIDDLGTRFAGVTALSSLTVNGRAFLAAGGTDNGISLFTLLPGGQLLHLHTLADAIGTTLAAPSAIAMTLAGSEIQIFVTSGQEAGLTMLRVDVAALGLTLASGAASVAGSSGSDLMVLTGGDALMTAGAGSDILRDGAGNDELRGGTGDDIFVLAADGHADTILDFEPGRDRLDLTLFPYLRNLGQLTFTPLAAGIAIQYGLELLTVLTADGRSLTAADFPAPMLLPLTRFPVATDPAGPSPAAQLLRQGTSGDDTMSGTDGSDFLNGMAGNDLIMAGAGADHVDGGTGFDIVSYAGLAAAGIDLGDPQANWGSAAGHSFVAVEGFLGSAFADAIRLGSADDSLAGGDGDDSLDGGAGNDTIFGGYGDDDIRGAAGQDRIDAGEGNDRVSTGDGDDRADLHDGDDIASGGMGRDSIVGGAGDDLLSGNEGDDSLDGGSDDDTLVGDAGNDTLLGGAGRDRLYGGDGADWMDAGADSDLLLGGGGDDTLFGGDGDDTLLGGTGNDSLTGGLGTDVFVFEGFRPGEADTIADFANGIDQLWLRYVSGADDAARFAALNITAGGTGALVAYGGHMILLAGVSASTIDHGDIAFI